MDAFAPLPRGIAYPGLFQQPSFGNGLSHPARARESSPPARPCICVTSSPSCGSAAPLPAMQHSLLPRGSPVGSPQVSAPSGPFSSPVFASVKPSTPKISTRRDPSPRCSTPPPINGRDSASLPGSQVSGLRSTSSNRAPSPSALEVVPRRNGLESTSSAALPERTQATGFDAILSLHPGDHRMAGNALCSPVASQPSLLSIFNYEAHYRPTPDSPTLPTAPKAPLFPVTPSSDSATVDPFIRLGTGYGYNAMPASPIPGSPVSLPRAPRGLKPPMLALGPRGRVNSDDSGRFELSSPPSSPSTRTPFSGRVVQNSELKLPLGLSRSPGSRQRIHSEDSMSHMSLPSRGHSPDVSPTNRADWSGRIVNRVPPADAFSDSEPSTPTLCPVDAHERAEEVDNQIAQLKEQIRVLEQVKRVAEEEQDLPVLPMGFGLSGTQEDAPETSLKDAPADRGASESTATSAAQQRGEEAYRSSPQAREALPAPPRIPGLWYGPYVPGDVAALSGLQNAHLNGTTVEVVLPTREEERMHAGSGRLIVRTGDGRRFAVLPERLRPRGAEASPMSEFRA